MVPGADEKNYTRSWAYTSDDRVADIVVCDDNARIMREADNEKELSEVKDTKFMILRDKAFDYAKEIMDPGRVNWVHVDFIWY